MTQTKRRKVLVTGGCGFIGRAVVRHLLKQGDAVSILDNLSGSCPHFTAPAPLALDDVRNVTAWASLPRHDLIIHLAASFANAKSVEVPMADAQTNILGTILAAQAARDWGVPLIYAGSSSSYGEPDLDHNGEPIAFTEDSPLRPHTPYALSKLTGEHYARMIHPEGTRVLRLFNVYGPGDIPGQYRNAIPNMVLSAERHGRIPVLGPNSGRDFTHVEDVAEVFVKAHTLPPDVFNVCSGTCTPMSQVAHVISRVTKAKIETQPARTWDKVASRFGSNDKLRFVMPEFESRDFPTEIYFTISWLREYIQENDLATR